MAVPIVMNGDIVNGIDKIDLKEDLVTPWEVATTSETGIDYDKLIGKEICLFLCKCYSPGVSLFSTQLQ